MLLVLHQLERHSIVVTQKSFFFCDPFTTENGIPSLHDLLIMLEECLRSDAESECEVFSSVLEAQEEDK